QDISLRLLRAGSKEKNLDGELTEEAKNKDENLAGLTARSKMEKSLSAFITKIELMVDAKKMAPDKGGEEIDSFSAELIKAINLERETKISDEANFGLLKENMDKLKGDIGSLMTGSSTAFRTSIWGIAASLLFLLCERTGSIIVMSKVRKVQRKFSNEYPLYVPEKTMIELTDSTRESESQLKGLAVAIGDQMQAAINSIGESIKDAVRDATQSGAEELGNKSAELMSKAITAELQNLESTMENIAEKFKGDFDRANEGLTSVVGNLGGVLDGLKGSVDGSGQIVKDAVKRMEGQGEILQSMTESASKLDQAAEKLREMRNTFDESSQRNKDAADSQNRAANLNLEVVEKFNKISELLPEMSEQIGEAARIIASLGQPLGNLNSVLEKFPNEIKEIDANREKTDKDSAAKIIEMTDELVRNVSEAADKFTAVSTLTESLSASSTSLESASEKLSEFGSNLDAASDKQEEAARASERAANAGERAAEKLEPLPESIEEAMQIVGSVGEGMVSGADAVKDSLDAAKLYQEQWFEGVEIGMEALRESLQKLIDDYGSRVEDQTRERFQHWAEQLQGSYSKFADLTQSLEGQIEELIDAQDNS
ncbi:hypothetical protein OAK16_04995, partial [Verrucomicrobia bacterium]|nr:hypothetical protein [Verrucomicrobiota bacterium]